MWRHAPWTLRGRIDVTANLRSDTEWWCIGLPDKLCLSPCSDATSLEFHWLLYNFFPWKSRLQKHFHQKVWKSNLLLGGRATFFWNSPLYTLNLYSVHVDKLCLRERILQNHFYVVGIVFLEFRLFYFIFSVGVDVTAYGYKIDLFASFIVTIYFEKRVRPYIWLEIWGSNFFPRKREVVALKALLELAEPVCSLNMGIG